MKSTGTQIYKDTVDIGKLYLISLHLIFLPPTNCWKCQIYLLSFHFTLHKILASNTLPRFNTSIFGIFISNFYGRLICKPEQLSKELLSEFFLLSSRFERQWKMENRIQQPILVNINLSAKQRSWYQTSSIHFI